MDVQYSVSEDLKLDLYYLMDMSQTMSDDKETLSNLGEDLANTMTELTENFKIGFGTFVDKVTLPFVK